MSSPTIERWYFGHTQKSVHCGFATGTHGYDISIAGLSPTHSPTTKTKDILVTAENADAGDSINMATDPVCLAIIDEDATTPTSTYRNENYYFCCNYCKKQFDENPRRYSRISHDISVDLGSMK
jgi:YHS domain-containing protein